MLGTAYEISDIFIQDILRSFQVFEQTKSTCNPQINFSYSSIERGSLWTGSSRFQRTFAG